MGLPVGLVYDGAGHVVPDPNAGMQHAIRHLFALFARTGSARAVVAAFHAENLLIPVRIRTGPRKGELARMPQTAMGGSSGEGTKGVRRVSRSRRDCSFACASGRAAARRSRMLTWTASWSSWRGQPWTGETSGVVVRPGCP